MRIVNSSGNHDFYYIYQGDNLVARLNADGTKYFYHADHLGSTSLITDQNGNVVENEFYSPFGESLSVNDDEEFKLYTGQFKDSVGQYYYGARYYKPEWIIFVMGDPEIQNPYNPQYLNHYAYAKNNPYLYLDPNGKNARVYLDKDAVYGIGGHIAVGVDDSNNPGQEIIFENTGIGTNIQVKVGANTIFDTERDADRILLSLTGKYEANIYLCIDYVRE